MLFIIPKFKIIRIMNNTNITISKLSQSNSTVDIIWKDNKISNFHFLWLRDNCPYGIHPTAKQRSFNILSVSDKIHPKKITINKDGKLEIEWSEGKHISHFEPKWLRSHCYTINKQKKYVSPYILWNSSLQNKRKNISINYEEIMEDDKGLIKWLEQLHFYGISILKNAPTKKKSALKILKRISHIRETFFGSPFEVINIPKPNNTAYTAEGLRNHTDLPYYEYSPGYQFLHCLVNEATGGLSSAVDGFNVAKYLEKNDPDAYNILTKTYVKFKDNDYTQNTIRIFHSPLITLNKDNDFNDIRFSVATMAAIDCDPNIMKKFYLAYKKFATLIHDDKFSIKFRLKPGDIFCFNNRRILHGRTKFDPNSGNRHLQGYYIDRDEILSRLNYLNNLEV